MMEDAAATGQIQLKRFLQSSSDLRRKNWNYVVWTNGELRTR